MGRGMTTIRRTEETTLRWPSCTRSAATSGLRSQVQLRANLYQRSRCAAQTRESSEGVTAQVRGSGQESCYQLILEQSPSSISKPGLTHHLSCHGKQPLQNILGSWWTTSLVPGARGPQ